MTVSLLFYHMTRVQSLEMGPRIAGFFSVSLILVAVTLTVMALWTYFVRVTELLEDKTLTPAERNEKQFKFVYLVTGILIVLIEVSLCVVIVLGSTVKRKR
jgi:heme/copper-type cytochrome/quinol oxidase subunit 2